MSIVCPICTELLLSASPYKISNSIVTTKCGHLYHSDCLNTFFETHVSEETESDNEFNGGIFAKSSCPSCQNVIYKKNLIRIYPSEDDNCPLDKVIAERNALRHENQKLKGENERLTYLNGNFRLPFLSQDDNPDESERSQSPSLKIRRHDLVVWFPDDMELTTRKGTVRWIDETNQILHAGVEFENEVTVVPVSQLILCSDFESQSESESKIPSNDEESAVRAVRGRGPSQPRVMSNTVTHNFERSFNDFTKLGDTAVSEYRTLDDDTNNLVSEEIIALPIAIEDQLRSVTSLRSQFINNERLIENLKKLTDPLLAFDDITTEEISVIQAYISSLEQIRNNCKKNLKTYRQKFTIALGHSQKIKSFVDAGSWWLNNITAKFQILMQQTEKLTTEELLKMRAELKFRTPQMEHLTTAYNFFQGPRHKLKRNDEMSLKSAIDTFQELRRRKCFISHIMLGDQVRVVADLVEKWFEEFKLIQATQFGDQLLPKLRELDTWDAEIKVEMAKLTELEAAFSKEDCMG